MLDLPAGGAPRKTATCLWQTGMPGCSPQESIGLMARAECGLLHRAAHAGPWCAQQDLHIFERADAGAALADFAFGQGVVGIVAYEGREIECDGEADRP